MDSSSPIKLVTKADAAVAFSVCVKSIDNYIKQGLLPQPVPFAGKDYWHPDTFSEFLYRTFAVRQTESKTATDLLTPAEAANEPQTSKPSRNAKATRLARMTELNRG